MRMRKALWVCVKVMYFVRRSLSHVLGIDPREQMVQYSRENRSFPEADKWALSEFIHTQLVSVVGVRPFPLDELLMMSASVAYFQPELIVEWGTHIGASARVFYEVMRYLGLNIQIHSTDLPPNVDHIENLQDEWMRGLLVRGLDVHLHLGDGLEVARLIIAENPGKLPLFFLDGDHAYLSILRELNGLKDFSSRAVVLVHDTFYQGSEANYNCGPYEALTNFTQLHGYPMYSTNLGLPGMSLTYW